VRENDISRYGIAVEDFQVDSKPNDDINGALIRCIKSSGMTVTEFCRVTGIAQTTMARYRQKKCEPSLETIVTACIVLRTNIFQALYLISVAGYNIFYSEEKKVYLLLLMLSWYSGIGIDEANDILVSLNMKPLKVKSQLIKGNGGQGDG